MADFIASYIQKMNNGPNFKKQEIVYTGRKILELIGGAPCNGKSTYAPDGYEVSKVELINEKFNYYSNLPKKVIDVTESNESNENVEMSSEMDVQMNAEQEKVAALETSDVSDTDSDISEEVKVKEVVELDINQKLLQLVKLEMENDVPLIQIVDTFTERRLLDPFLELAINNKYEIIIKYPKVLMYYNLRNVTSLNDQVKYLSQLNSKKKKPIPPEDMYEMCMNAMAVRQWITNVEMKVGTDPEKWRAEIQPFMKIKPTKKYKDDQDSNSKKKSKRILTDDDLLPQKLK